MQQQKEAQEAPFPTNMRDAHIRRAVITHALGLCCCLLLYDHHGAPIFPPVSSLILMQPGNVPAGSPITGQFSRHCPSVWG